jgi:competence protein ComEA
MRLVLASVVIALVLSLALVACGGGAKEEAPAALDGEALVEERCTKCHDLSVVTSAKKSAEGWKANVERMVQKGAQLDEAEQEVVIDYLTEAYPE